MNVSGYLQRTACPICKAGVEVSRPAVSSSPPAEDLPFGTHGAFLSGYTGQRVFFTYNRCGGCEGLYCPTYFSQEQLDQLYSRQAENMADVPLAAREATQKSYLDILTPHGLLQGKDYLEIGPDIGLFAGYCANAGRFGTFHLFEPNIEVHAALEARLAGRYTHITGENYRAGLLQNESVGAAVAIHVMDHLIEPERMLLDLYGDLAPGGQLFLVVHNEGSLLARLLGRRWPPYTLQHPQLYSPQSLSRLVSRCGFEVLEQSGTRNYFPIMHLARAGMTVAGFDRLCPDWNIPITLGLKLGNMALVARKPAAT